MKRIFALFLSFAVLFSCLVLPAGAMFDPTPVYQVQAASAYIVNTDTNIIVYDKDSTRQLSRNTSERTSAKIRFMWTIPLKSDKIY